MVKEKIIEILVDKGNRLLSLPFQRLEFTKNEKADDLLNDIANYPHAFVLACVMDRQFKAERAWLIPYAIKEEIGGFEMTRLINLDDSFFKEVFFRRSLHRFNDIMSILFYEAIHLIHKEYNDDASRIWADSPGSATVVLRFLKFKGVGIKIATMAANILTREFKIPLKDRLCIDISPDVQVRRVFTRLGLIRPEATVDEIIYVARELYPEYPGIFDLSIWEIGRKWCRPKNPVCDKCELEAFCPKIF